MPKSEEHLDWLLRQIDLKEKQLKKHAALAIMSEDESTTEMYSRMAYDDKQYLIMLRYSLRLEMEYKD